MTYRVHFSGMVAFVPTKLERADGEAKKVKQMRLLLLDGRPPHKAPDGEELTPHFAFLRFRLADLASDSPRRPDLVGNNGYGVCFLNHEELDFDSGGGDDQLEATLTPLQASYGQRRDQPRGEGQCVPQPIPLSERADALRERRRSVFEDLRGGAEGRANGHPGRRRRQQGGACQRGLQIGGRLIARQFN